MLDWYLVPLYLLLQHRPQKAPVDLTAAKPGFQRFATSDFSQYSVIGAGMGSGNPPTPIVVRTDKADTKRDDTWLSLAGFNRFAKLESRDGLRAHSCPQTPPGNGPLRTAGTHRGHETSLLKLYRLYTRTTEAL